MTQKIFDTDNEKDMKLLWSILPSRIKHIEKAKPFTYDGKLKLINIAWRDKTEITRPVNYEDMIGCVCKFSTCPIRIGGCFIGVLDNIDKDSPCKFHVKGGGWFEYCEPAKKSELKFWGD